MRHIDVDTGKRISKIGLGTHQFASREWGYGDEYVTRHAHVIVRRALELGVTLFDTAEIYGFEARYIVTRALREGVALADTARIGGFGRSEQILGQALGDARPSAFVATKFYPAVPAAPVVERHAVASANRLGAHRLDLYQVHQPDRLVPGRDVMHGIRALQQVGLVGEVGISNGSLQRWRAAEEALGGRVLSDQVGYSLVARSAERDLLPFAERTGRVIIAHSPLAQGLLSGTYHPGHLPTPGRASASLFLPQNLERARPLLRTLHDVGDAHDATPAQVALAWVIHRPAVAAIPGVASVEQLERNVAAADIKLAHDEYEALQAASDRFRPVIARRSRAQRIRTLLAR